MPICRRLFEQYTCLDFSFARDRAGRSRPARIAMMAMTTSSSISVKPRQGGEEASWWIGPGSGMQIFSSRLLTEASRLTLFELMAWKLVFISYLVSELVGY